MRNKPGIVHHLHHNCVLLCSVGWFVCKTNFNIGKRINYKVLTSKVIEIVTILAQSAVLVSVAVRRLTDNNILATISVIISGHLWAPGSRVTIFGPPGGCFGFCRQCGVVGGEQVATAPLSWCFHNPLHSWLCSG